VYCNPAGGVFSGADTTFIAHAHQALPAALDEIDLLRNAVRLASVGDRGIPWPDVSEADVDSYVTFVRKQRDAAKPAKEKP